MTGPWPTQLAFWVFAVAAVWTGYRVFATDSMVRATFLLLASFINVGAIMLLLAAEFLGFALVFMMAVEMTVMALFMVMFMMNPAGLNPMTMTHLGRVPAATGALLFAGLTTAVVVTDWPDRPAPTTADPIRELGHELMGGSMMVFESAGVALLATMIVAIALSSHRGRHGTALEGSTPPALDPATGEPAQPEEEAAARSGHGHHAHDGDGGHS